MPTKTRKGGRGAGKTSTTARTTTTSLRVLKRRDISSTSSENESAAGFEQPSFLSQYSQLEDRDNSSGFTVYFVLPRGTSEATCDPNLATAIVLCQDHHLRCKWITEEQCLELEPQPRNIFVLSPFDGPAFNRLEECRKANLTFEIVGPQCIRYALKCTESNEDIGIVSQGFAPFTLSMRGMVVTLSGISNAAEKVALEVKIKRMNGYVTSVFTQSVTHVVTDDILRVKCTVAYAHGIPVMTTKWVDAVWDNCQMDLLHATNSEYVKYTCPVFHKLTVCLSQISLDMKKALKNAIETNGGTCTGELIRYKTNVLVAAKGEGDKFHYSQLWNIPCVSPDWVEASKSAGHVLPVKDFMVVAHVVKASTPKNSIIVPLDEINFSVISNIPFPNINHCLEDLTLATAKSDSQIQLSEQDLNVLKKAVKHGPYLDGCKIYISGSQKSEVFRKLLSASAAVCLGRLNENVTHFLVTEKRIPEPELEILRSLDPRPHVITVDWLVESAKNGNIADEEGFTFDISPKSTTAKKPYRELSKEHEKTCIRNEISDLVERQNSKQEARKVVKPKDTDSRIVAEKGETSRGPNFPPTIDALEEVGNLELAVTRPHLKEVTMSNSQNHPSSNKVANINSQLISQDGEDGTQDPTDFGSSMESESVYPFTGRRMKVILDNIEEKLDIEQLIEDNNGEIVDDSFSILILSPIYAAFPMKSSLKCFTKQWVVDCIEKNSFDIPESYHYKPLSAFDGMSTIMTSIVVAVSHYSNPEKEYLSKLVTSMGGLYQEVFARKVTKNSTAQRTTHLICPIKDNEKFRAAKKWGTPVVTAEWIVECFLERKLVDESRYNPELRNDSDTSVSCMPRTPGDVRVNLASKKKGNVTGSIISNCLASTEKKIVTNKRATPIRGPFMLHDGGEAGGAEAGGAEAGGAEAREADISKDRSFLAWLASDEYKEKYEGKPAPDPSESFLEYYALQEEAEAKKRKEESFVGDGLSRAESLAVRDDIAWMGSNSLILERNKKIQMECGTPKSVMMARTWEKIMETFPVDPELLTSTPKTPALKIKHIGPSNSIEKSFSAIKPCNGNEPNEGSLRGMNSSCKRSSDSSLEAEVTGLGGLKKKMRFSTSGSEVSNLTDDGSIDERDISPNSSPSVESIKPVSASNNYKPVETVASSKSSMQALNSLLADDGDAEKMKAIAKSAQFTGAKNRVSDNLNKGNEKINPDELDAPHVVWIDEENDVKPQEALKIPKSAKNQRSTRSGNSKGNECVSTTSSVGKRETRGSKGAVGVPRNQRHEAVKQLNIEVPRNAIFMLSGLSDDDKDKAVETIASLGGRISTSPGFDPDAFALISNSLARSEKVLGSVAASKCLLKLAYISESQAAKMLLPLTEKFVWKAEDGNTGIEKDIAKAGYSWLIRGLRDSNDKPMANMKFYMVEAVPTKRAAYSRLIQAGGGQVVSTHETANYILSDGKGGSTSNFDQNIIKHPLILNTIILYDSIDPI